MRLNGKFQVGSELRGRVKLLMKPALYLQATMAGSRDDNQQFENSKKCKMYSKTGKMCTKVATEGKKSVRMK